jgi:hypothetical protein
MTVINCPEIGCKYNNIRKQCEKAEIFLSFAIDMNCDSCESKE